MAENTAYLSPNGQWLTDGDGPATRLVVGTVQGVATLRRASAAGSWSLAGRSLTDRHVGSLVYEPGSGKLFAGAHHDGGLWVSDDGEGKAWRQLANGLDRPHVYSLSARRQGDRVSLFLGTSPAALYRSDDLGESWTEVTSLLDVPETEMWTFPPPPHIPHVKSTVFHPSEPETIFALVEQGAFLKSVDDGKSWVELKSYSQPDDVVYRDVHRLLIDPDDPRIFWMATGNGLYRSRDAGETWDQLTRRGERMGYPDFLFFEPGNHHTLYMGGSYKNPGAWYKDGIADSSVMRSTDDGRTWLELDNGMPKPVVGAFEAMCQHRWKGGMMLAVGTATGEVYTTENGGASWTCIAEGLAPVAKDDHHRPFLSPEERKRGAEVRNLA